MADMNVPSDTLVNAAETLAIDPSCTLAAFTVVCGLIKGSQNQESQSQSKGAGLEKVAKHAFGA